MASVKAILFVAKDSVSPTRLLFWYPGTIESSVKHDTLRIQRSVDYFAQSTNFYALQPFQQRDLLGDKVTANDSVAESADDLFANECGFDSAEALADTLNPGTDFCESPFEIKIAGSLFVGHPCVAEETQSDETFVCNVVIMLDPQVTPDAIPNYQSLCQRLASAYRHQERHQAYLSSEITAMNNALDSASKGVPLESPDHAINMILGQSRIARILRDTYTALKRTGRVNIEVDGWVSVSFCAHVDELPVEGKFPYPQSINCSRIRPYHTVLLRTDSKTLLSKLPVDCSSALHRFIEVANPLITFVELAPLVGVTVTQVIRLAMHLVAWEEAKIIYPVCATNVYVVNPNIRLTADLVQEFRSKFEMFALSSILADFSQPYPLIDHTTMFAEDDEERLEWLLQHDMLLHLQMRIFLDVNKPQTKPRIPVGTDDEDSDRSPTKLSSSLSFHRNTSKPKSVSETPLAFSFDNQLEGIHNYHEDPPLFAMDTDTFVTKEPEYQGEEAAAVQVVDAYDGSRVQDVIAHLKKSIGPGDLDMTKLHNALQLMSLWNEETIAQIVEVLVGEGLPQVADVDLLSSYAETICQYMDESDEESASQIEMNMEESSQTEMDFKSSPRNSLGVDDVDSRVITPEVTGQHSPKPAPSKASTRPQPGQIKRPARHLRPISICFDDDAAKPDFMSIMTYNDLRGLPEAEADEERFLQFLRLCKYFGPDSTLEDIMWQENLTRRELLDLLDAFDSVLIRTVY